MTGPLPEHEVDQQAAGARDAHVTSADLEAVISSLQGMRVVWREVDPAKTYTAAQFATFIEDSIAAFQQVREALS